MNGITQFKIVASLQSKLGQEITEVTLVANFQFSMLGQPWQIVFGDVTYQYESAGFSMTQNGDGVTFNTTYIEVE